MTDDLCEVQIKMFTSRLGSQKYPSHNVEHILVMTIGGVVWGPTRPLYDSWGLGKLTLLTERAPSVQITRFFRGRSARPLGVGLVVGSRLTAYAIDAAA